jgi:integrase
MEKFDLVEAWLDNVAYSHSGSESTRIQYKRNLASFCSFIGKTPKQILDEYEGMTDREFRRKYAQYVRALISKDLKHGYASNTIQQHVIALTSFFKYNDLPLGHVPIGKGKIKFHNRDITKQEILKIMKVSRVRDQAFYSMMAQGGLRPFTLCSLRVKHIEPEFSKGIVPCKINVPEELAKGEFGAYFTFIGEEAIRYLQAYLTTRPGIGPEDYLFSAHGLDKPLSPKSISRIFVRTIEKLKEKGIMDFEQKHEGKPRNVRLYNLRKYFRKYGGQAGVEYVNFWMGHKANYEAPHIPESDEHYFSREDVEFHRQLYKEKAMPHLRLETPTASETDKIIQSQAQEIKVLKEQIVEFNRVMELLRNPNVIKVLEKAAKEHSL